jgi:hypothetical protein
MKTQTKILGLVSLVALGMAVACGSDSTTGSPPPAAGGSAGSGGSAAGSAGKSGGGTGGSAAGTSGAGGSTAGTSGGGAGGSTAGTAGTSGGGAGGSTAGTSGTSGEGGEAGASNVPDILYDFEADAATCGTVANEPVSCWSADTGVTLATSTDQAVTGTHSLKVSVPAIALNTNYTVSISVSDLNAPIFPGAVLTYHVWSPAAASADGLYMQAISQYNNYGTFDPGTMPAPHNGNSPITIKRGDWTTWTYTVPYTYPGGLEQIGVQFGVGGTGNPFPGGDFYIDSISMSGGDPTCTGAGSGSYDFEAAADVSAWTVDGSATDVALSMSTTEFKTGANSMKVSFTAVPAATSATAPTQRNIYVGNPKAFCGQTITYNVWTPTGSDNLNVRAYAQTGWYAGFPTAQPVTITRGDWTTITFTLPNPINAYGLQRIGLQFENKDTANAFTGDVYVDAVTWP